MSFPAYPRYSASSIDYLGEIPEHWWAAPLKRLAAVRNGRDYKEVEEVAGPYPVIGSGGEFARASTYLYSGNSVLFGRKGTVDRPLIVSGSFWTVDTMFYTEIDQSTDPRFLFYSGTIIPFGRISTNTALPSVAQEDLSNTYLPQPPLAEQKAIADFLDHETARIDALIEEQQRLIDLLREKRRSDVLTTVVGRNNESDQLKDRGIEWAGEIPARWDVVKLGWRISCRSGDGLSAAEVEEAPDEEHCIPVIGGNGILGYTDRTNLGQESVVIGRVGALCGNVHHIEGPAWITDNAIFLTRIEGFSPDYLCLLLNAANLNRHASLTAQPLLTGEIIRQQKVPAPALDEQKRIVQRVTESTRRMDSLTQEAKAGIATLKERRAALISASVTGKIDVRDWKRSAPSTEQALPHAAEKEGRYG